MDQLTLSFHDEFLLKLKTTEWEFESRPKNLDKATPDSKFVQLDRSISDAKANDSGKNNSLKSNK